MLAILLVMMVVALRYWFIHLINFHVQTAEVNATIMKFSVVYEHSQSWIPCQKHVHMI